MLKPATYTSQTHSQICLWWFMIPHRIFWWRQITLPALTGHTVLRAWRCSSRTPTLRDGMCKAATPVGKERCVTSQWRQVGDVALFGGDFERIFFVNTCNITLFSRVIIGIDHGRSGVTATTPSWFVVRRGRPSSCALGTSRHRTTNHLGVVAVTPSRPWSFPQTQITKFCTQVIFTADICSSAVSLRWVYEEYLGRMRCINLNETAFYK